MLVTVRRNTLVRTQHNMLVLVLHNMLVIPRIRKGTHGDTERKIG